MRPHLTRSGCNSIQLRHSREVIIPHSLLITSQRLYAYFSVNLEK